MTRYILVQVSIILPVYNAGSYLSAALASLLLQDHSDVEIIAINDGSTDASGDVLRLAAASDSRITVVERPNRGLIATLNEGLALASSDFIARMDADDIAYPNRISTQLRAFAADPRLALSGSNFDTIYARNRMLPKVAPAATEPDELRVLSRFFTILRHPAVMFRRSVMPEGLLRYDEAYPCAEDFDLFRRIAAQCSVAQTSEPLLAYRLHQNSVSATRMATMVRSHVKILEEGLRQWYPEASGTGFGRIADEVSPGSVASAADLIRRLSRLASVQPESEEHAFRIGVTETFYFLFSLICNSGDYRIACEFVEESERWDLIRRRERPILQAARLVPAAGAAGYAALNLQLDIVRASRSRALRIVVPGHQAITALAESFARAPRGELQLVAKNA